MFQLYFGSVATLSLIVLLFINSMENLGAYPIRNAMAAIFSPRDLRAISLTHRLRRVRNVDEEEQTLKAMGETQSGLSLKEILSELRSPRFTIRAQALQALADLPLDEAAIQALISEVKNHAFTTAYLAAEIMGKRGLSQGIPALRNSLDTQDFFLQGKAMVALARLQDKESYAKIRAKLRETTNSRVIIHGATALELVRDVEAIPLLLEKIGMKMQPYVRDELMLSMAGILGFGDWFYLRYVSFLESAASGIAMLGDFVTEAQNPTVPKELLKELLTRLPQRDRSLYSGLAVELLQSIQIEVAESDVSTILSEAVLDTRLIKLERFLFLVTATIVWHACRRTAP